MTTRSSIFDHSLLRRALLDSLRKFDPRVQLRNPVMFVVFIGALAVSAVSAHTPSAFNLQIALWLWFTVLFANFAEAMAEGRGKAQAAALRRMRVSLKARRLRNGREESVAAAELKKGDEVLCEAGDTIPTDGEIIEGVASVDESAITGESAPVIRESGGDRSAVTAGTRVISDRIKVRVTSEPGQTFLDRMIALVEGSVRGRTPNEQALGVLLAGLTFIFLLAVVTLPAFLGYAEREGGVKTGGLLSLPVLVSLLVCLIPTTIGGLLSAIGISGIDRLSRRNVLATSGRAVEAAGDVDVLLLDKTGTITLGNRMAVDFLPARGVDANRLADAAQLASLADETPEGRSVVVLAKQLFALRGRELADRHAHFVPFSAQTRMSGVDLPADAEHPARSIRKGAAGAIRQHVEQQDGIWPADVEAHVETISRQGGTPLVVCEDSHVLGVIFLKDVVKGGIRERFAQLRRMGIRTIMITGDNAATAAAIAAEAGVDDFLAEATPEDKLNRIRAEQADGHLVAMTGDGTNDAPALAQADVGVAMHTGTQTAREAGNMVDLDSSPTKLLDIVEIGKQMLITRGALTTFSVANDVAKYFAILPALFLGLYAGTGSATGPLAALNIMRLASPESAVLSAIIFNALIIVALIPLALRGVAYRATGASLLLRRNLLIYGAGGLAAPFLGIKLIDLALTALGWI
ncbi:MAG TPA: potassium-transporting ATPase subunit KdpB [Pontiellaceae bacterium]|nr:potassium-transporting ATPase subunit KdpB [Pontiellaceae bacterium]HPR83345.1 potassium-transporting ATPase subunit KdpB [Pontiellaceae bacterium]